MLKDTKQSAVRRNVVILLTALVVLRSLINNMVSLSPMPALYSTFAEILLVVLLWALCPHGGRRTKMEWLLLCYAGWGILTRFLLKDLELIYSVRLEVLMLFEICVAFFTTHDVDRKTASRIVSLVTAILCAILTVWAICGMAVVMTDITELRVLGLVAEVRKRYVVFSPVSRNETSVWFMVGLWLLAYQWTVCKRKLWRIPMAFSMLLQYFLIALQRSRTMYIAVAISVGLLAASRLLELGWKKLPKYLLMAVTAAACAFVVYKSFFVINDFFAVVFKMPSLQGYLQNRKTVMSRSEIWKGEIQFLMDNPRVLLFGQPKGTISENMLRYYTGKGTSIPHLHNGFLQVLAMYGLPGLVLLCSFLFVLARKVLRVHFAKGMTDERILSAILIGLVIDSLMEPVFTAWMGLSTSMFMLVAGWLTRENAGEDSDGQA